MKDDNKRNTKKEKMKENKKYPYKNMKVREEENKGLLGASRDNPWILATFFFGVIVLFLLIGEFVTLQAKWDKQNNLNPEDLCSEIQGTPAWVQNGEIIDYGYNSFGDQTIRVVNEVLIPEQIYFLYNPNCGWCKKQIEYFGKDWDDYVNSGLAIDCMEYRE